MLSQKQNIKTLALYRYSIIYTWKQHLNLMELPKIFNKVLEFPQKKIFSYDMSDEWMNQNQLIRLYDIQFDKVFLAKIHIHRLLPHKNCHHSCDLKIIDWFQWRVSYFRRLHWWMSLFNEKRIFYGKNGGLSSSTIANIVDVK